MQVIDSVIGLKTEVEAPGKIVNGVIGRIDREDNRYYVDPTSERMFDSVTAVLSATNSKSWLTNWAAKLAAEFAVDQHEHIGQTINLVSRDAAVDMVKGESRRRRELKAEIGTHQHDILEALILDAPIPMVPDHLDGIEIDGEAVDQDAISDGLLNFITDFEPQWEMAEATVANTIHGYAGTLDVAAWLPKVRRAGRPAKGVRVVLDLKTGQNLDETARPQIVAYKNATEVWLDELGNKASMPQVDLCGIVHLRQEYARGYKLFLVDPDDEDFYMARFLHCHASYRDQDQSKKLRLVPFYPPLADGSQPLPLIEDVEGDNFGKFRKKLVAAGLERISDLAELTAAEVQDINGIGPAAITACRTVMGRFSLAFKGEVA